MKFPLVLFVCFGRYLDVPVRHLEQHITVVQQLITGMSLAVAAAAGVVTSAASSVVSDGAVLDVASVHVVVVAAAAIVVSLFSGFCCFEAFWCC